MAPLVRPFMQSRLFVWTLIRGVEPHCMAGGRGAVRSVTNTSGSGPACVSARFLGAVVLCCVCPRVLANRTKSGIYLSSPSGVHRVCSRGAAVRGTSRRPTRGSLFVGSSPRSPRGDAPMGCGCHTCRPDVSTEHLALCVAECPGIPEFLWQSDCAPLEVEGFSGPTRRLPTDRPVRHAVPLDV